MRIIDADRLKSALMDAIDGIQASIQIETVMDVIENQPTLDVERVARSRWEEKE